MIIEVNIHLLFSLIDLVAVINCFDEQKLTNNVYSLETQELNVSDYSIY